MPERLSPFTTAARPKARLCAWHMLFALGMALPALPPPTITAQSQPDDPPLLLDWSAAKDELARDVAWGDYDGDGDLDLAVANFGQPSRLYRNAGGLLRVEGAWTAQYSDTTQALAWGDYDGDGDLDLALGNDEQPNRLYRNAGGTLVASEIGKSQAAGRTWDLAWGDYDGDGDLDLAVGRAAGERNQLYRNDAGTLTITTAWQPAEQYATRAKLGLAPNERGERYR